MTKDMIKELTKLLIHVPTYVYSIHVGTRLPDDTDEPPTCLFYTCSEATEEQTVIEAIQDILAMLCQALQQYWPVLPYDKHDPDNELTLVYERLIKVHIPGESMWAARLPRGRAELRNTPTQQAYSYGDIVALDADGYEVNAVLERTYRQGVAEYTIEDGASEASVRAKHEALCTHFKQHGILCEGWVAGLVGCAIPVGMSVETAEEHASTCPAISSWRDTLAVGG
jgi:hypothetical protein